MAAAPGPGCTSYEVCGRGAAPQAGKSPHEPLNLILVGRSGTGKSATGNTILGRPTFVSRLRAQPVTEKCESDTTTVDGQDVVVVDTPSLHQMLAVHRIKEEVRHFCTEGFNIFVLVFQLGRFTEEDKMAVKQLEHIFGEEIMKYVIVLFTRKEDLGDGKLEDYIKKTDNKALKNILKKCEKRACAFNNRETGSAQESQVRDLLTMANDLRKSCGGYDFTRNQKSSIFKKLARKFPYQKHSKKF